MNFTQFVSGTAFGAILAYGVYSTVGATAEVEAARPQAAVSGVQVHPVPAVAPTTSAQSTRIVDGKINDMAVFMVEYVARSANQSGTTDIVKLVADQMKYVESIQARSHLFMAGMFLNDGNRTVLFAAKTEDDARKVINDSPFAKSGYYTLRLRQLSVTHAGIMVGGGSSGPTEVTAIPDSSQAETP